ncbi:hypothetical protein, partial [Saccharothrix longispora]|uniref:hypothetical protein n=1 Tax=Saccharothrix longispora TaxID=33920 RepID=UPI0028FD1E77
MSPTETLKEIERDLATFIDPGTEVTVVGKEQEGVTLSWIVYELEEQARFETREGALRAFYRERSMPYADFLAEVADLRRLASNIVRVAAQGKTFEESIY